LSGKGLDELNRRALEGLKIGRGKRLPNSQVRKPTREREETTIPPLATRGKKG